MWSKAACRAALKMLGKDKVFVVGADADVNDFVFEEKLYELETSNDPATMMSDSEPLKAEDRADELDTDVEVIV